MIWCRRISGKPLYRGSRSDSARLSVLSPLTLLAIPFFALCSSGGLATARPQALPTPRPTATPREGVVRVLVAEPGGWSQGTGTLVEVDEQHGLVVTNWHVVRDAVGEIRVRFPNGRHFAARVIKVDSRWDLAALLISRPAARPISIAQAAPRPGDWLTIAGYGSGSYREASGRCTQYVSPGRQSPYEMVELAVAARQGDSGGPILDRNGQLAGVLFGSAGGNTSGSYAGRVRQFLASASLGVSSARGNGERPARRPLEPVPQWQPSGSAEVVQRDHNEPTAGRELQPLHAATTAARTDIPSGLRPIPTPGVDRPVSPPDAVPSSNAELSGGSGGAWERLVGDTPFEQAKTALAVIGVLSILGCILRATSK